MNAFELYNEHGKPCGIWACGKCRKVVLSPTWHDPNQPKSTREEAERCCRPPVCDTCHKEFKPRGSFDSRTHECPDCESMRWQVERDARLAKCIENAEDVTGKYDGPIYIEGSNGGDMGDGFYSSADIVSDYYEETGEGEGDDSVVWAFACKSRFEKLDIEHAIENLCEDGYEEMYHHITIPKSLFDAADEFNKMNEGALTVWETDYKRKVRINNESVER